MRYALLFVLVLLLVTPAVHAFGITPGRQTYDYRETITGKFTIVNNGADTLELTVIPRGDLASYVRVSESMVRMDPDDEQHTIEYTINVPNTLEPGDHKVEIYVLSLQSSGLGNSIVGAATGVVSQVIINVPYPGQYVRSRLDYDVASGTIHVPVFGLGREPIDDLSADIVIYGPTNDVVASERSDTRSLAVGAREEFSFPLDLEPGTYLARATVSFDGRTQVVERSIAAGRAQIIVQGVSVPEYQFGAISKLVLHTKSEWNEALDTTATVEFYGDGELIERVRSAQIMIDPFARADIDVYWDSAGYDPGDYLITVRLSVGDSDVERSFPVTLTPTSISVGASGNVVSGSGNVSIILVAVFVLVILNGILLFVLFRGRSKPKRR